MCHPNGLTHVVHRDSFIGVHTEESDGSGQYQLAPTSVVCVSVRHSLSIANRSGHSLADRKAATANKSSSRNPPRLVVARLFTGRRAGLW
jgi:hypothetical protein